MAARLVVFPIKKRNWCFSRSIDRTPVSKSESSPSPLTLKDLWKNVTSQKKPVSENAELVVDFIANKMNHAWVGLENAPQGSFKNKLHNLGLFLLSRVRPSEIFLKSITNDVNKVEVLHPSNLNPRLVRRRLRHIAMRGTIIHRRYFYGTVTLLPFTSALAILPLPNVPFFWMLFRTYSHWRALKGSERLLQLVSNYAEERNSARNADGKGKEKGKGANDSKVEDMDSAGLPLVLKPSEDLDRYLKGGLDEEDGLSKCVVADICKAYQLDTNAVLKYKNFM